MYARDPKLGPPSLEEEATYYSPETVQELRTLATRAIETETPFEFASTLKRADGSTVDFTTIGSTMTDDAGRVVRLIGTVLDVTERNRMDGRVRHLNSVLEAIRNINKLIIRERDPARLIQQACEMLVDQRGFRGAWILLADAAGQTTGWALAGHQSDSNLMLKWLNNGAKLPCFTESRARDGSVFVIETAKSCLSCPLAQRESHAYSLITPLVHRNLNLGVLGISSHSNLMIDEEEKTILSEFGADLAYALCDIELEKQRDRFAQIVTSSQEAMALIGPDYKYLEANDAYRQLIGATSLSLESTSVSAQLDPSFFSKDVKPNLERCFCGEKVEFETEVKLPGGFTKHVSAIYSPCYLPNGNVLAVAVCIRDITAQKRVIAKLVESESRFRLLSENAGVGIGYY
jgi:PAS domain S-box-containing protein